MTKIKTNEEQITVEREHMKLLGERVRERRRALQMTQEVAAGLAGLDMSYWSQLEGAKYDNPGLNTIHKIAHVLETSISYLIGESNNPRPILEPGQAAHDSESVYDLKNLTPEDYHDMEKAWLAFRSIDRRRRHRPGSE